MQDRYAGDVGDFMKLGLLRMITGDATRLRLGVNWYLAGDESHNADGKHVGYLQPTNSFNASLRRCDPALMDRLGVLVTTARSVAALEAARVLPTASLTYASRLEDGLSNLGRIEWHKAALRALTDADVVFVDPDNGIRVDRKGSKPAKFAFLEELADYSARGQSLIIYHHADRSSGGVPAQLARRFDELAAGTGVDPFGAVVARRGSTRFFIIVPAPAHCGRLEAALEAYERRWGPHSELIRYR